MSVNAELIRIFDEMSAAMELTGGQSFKVSAYARVARAIKDLGDDITTLATSAAALQKIEGVGASSAKKILEYLETGQIELHRKLMAKIPPGLLDVMAIPGLGPKTVKVLWEQGGVTDLASLKEKLATGELEKLPRLGAKALQNIRESIDFAESAGDRTRLGQALPLAEAIVDHLRSAKGVRQVAYAGSLRRGQETIGDIDILAAASDPDPVRERFRSMPGITKILVDGGTKVSLRLDRGVQVDLRLVDEDQFGAALMYFTGSKAHNVALRERAIKARMRLNEYGLFPDDGEDEPPQKRGIEPVAAATEEDIYAKLDLPWIPPEMREDRGELRGEPPKLIELDDIKAELHAHTTASDGRMSIEELAALAMSRGYHTIAVTDHSHASAQANGLTVERLRAHVEAVRAVNEAVEGITILAGTEVDILADGTLDYEDDVLAELDIVVASPHVALRQETARATERLIRAVSHPLVDILGHPTGRIINKREGLAPDMGAIIAAAIEHDTALEINANFMRLDLRDTHVRAVVEAGALIAINTDTHSAADMDQLRYGVLTARRGWLTAEGCVNAWPAKKLHGWLSGRRHGTKARRHEGTKV